MNSAAGTFEEHYNKVNKLSTIDKEPLYLLDIDVKIVSKLLNLEYTLNIICSFSFLKSLHNCNNHHFLYPLNLLVSIWTSNVTQNLIINFSFENNSYFTLKFLVNICSLLLQIFYSSFSCILNKLQEEICSILLYHWIDLMSTPSLPIY